MQLDDKPRRQVSQAPLKETKCHAGCGAIVFFRTTPRVFCEVCAPLRRAQRARDAAERQRRKRGVPEVKGQVSTCQRCHGEFVLNRCRNARFCGSCALEEARRRARDRVNRLSRERGAREVGRENKCSRCGDVFTVAAAKNHLCPPCGEKSVRMKFPDQVQKRNAYRRNWSATPQGRESSRGSQKRSRHRRKKDPGFTINERMSASVRQSLVLGKQGWRWEKLVGYTLAELMKHLERQFLRGMSWDNRGDWHIDHIIPLATFSFVTADDPEFRAAWALTNLRPLWSGDNLTKNSRRLHLL